MSQLFRPGANTLARLVLLALLFVPLFGALVAAVWVRGPYTTGQGRYVEQQVPFSHKHHSGDLGIDCRFCHGGVETGAVANVPATKVCMTCHSQIWTNSKMLAPVRQSFATGQPLRWETVNRVPDYVYFDHHVHVNNGVPCTACHGDTRAMPLTVQATPMTMQWCLECHRDPAKRLVPVSRVYDQDPYRGPFTREEAAAVHARVARLRGKNLIECSTCHR